MPCRRAQPSPTWRGTNPASPWVSRIGANGWWCDGGVAGRAVVPRQVRQRRWPSFS
jgi:hypothetical protein